MDQFLGSRSTLQKSMSNPRAPRHACKSLSNFRHSEAVQSDQTRMSNGRPLAAWQSSPSDRLDPQSGSPAKGSPSEQTPVADRRVAKTRRGTTFLVDIILGPTILHYRRAGFPTRRSNLLSGLENPPSYRTSAALITCSQYETSQVRLCEAGASWLFRVCAR